MAKFIRQLIYLGILFTLGCSSVSDDNFSEKGKLAMRDVGHNLLLSNYDHTSLVLPVIEIAPKKFSLSFEDNLEIYPDTLVHTIQESILKSKLPQKYLVEVLHCDNGVVAYSYEMNGDVDENIIPCLGRNLPKSCYSIHLKFKESSDSQFYNKGPIYIGLAFLGLTVFFLYRRSEDIPPTNSDKANFVRLGKFKFYELEHKLEHDGIEIKLSNKECELIQLFSAMPNQIIPRETLVKKVWEDKGVIVGRSLDTYVSKIRKKLKLDPEIKITNVHGVGYMLEIE